LNLEGLLPEAFFFSVLLNNTMRNYAIFGYVVGYLTTASLLCLVSFLVFLPFGIGYIGAELMGAFMTWATIQQWDSLNEHLRQHLEARGY